MKNSKTFSPNSGTEVMYFVVGKHGLYTGGSFLRREAIAEHISELGSTWYDCKKRGDRVVKCIVGWDFSNNS